MFAKKFRLPANIQLHSYTTTPYFTFRFGKNNLEYNRYGFVTSKQVDKRATVRNRVKRQLRGYLELAHKKLKTGYDLLFIIKASTKEALPVDLRDTIVKTLESEKLL